MIDVAPVAPTQAIGRAPFLRQAAWALFVLGIWQALLRVQNPGLMTDDSGEIVSAAAGLGVSHAPGYPLYALLGRLFFLLPVGSPAFRLNLMASLFTIAGALVLASCGRILVGRFTNLAPGLRTELLLGGVVVSLLACRSVLAQSLTAKGGLYTLLILAGAVLLRGLLQRPEGREPETILFLWAAGLGAHGQTQGLWLLWILVRLRQAPLAWDVRRLVTTATFMVIGISSLLYLPLRAHRSPDLNHLDPETWSALLDLLRRADTPGHDFILTGLAAYGRVGMKYLEILALHWWPGFAVFAVLGWVVLLRRQRPLAWALILQYVLLVGMVTLSAFFNEPESIYLYGNLLVASQVLPALTATVGLATISDRLGTRGGALFLALVLAAGGAWALYAFREQDKSRYALSEDFGRNLLRETPRDGVLLCDDDLSILPLDYLQSVKGLRPDVARVPLYALYAPWGVRDLAERHRDRWKKHPPAGFGPLVECLADPGCFRSGGFHFTRTLDVLERKGLESLAVRLSPRGLTFALPDDPEDPRKISAMVWQTTFGQRRRSLDLSPDLFRTEYTTRAYRRLYARPHLAAGTLLLAQGDLRRTWPHWDEARRIDPQSRGIFRGLAAYWAGAGWLELAERYARREAQLDPDPLNWLLWGGILLKLGRWDEAAGVYGKVLKVDPASSEAASRLDLALAARMQGAPEGWVQRRDSSDYQRLARDLEKEGLGEWALEAAALAGEGFNPRNGR